MQNPEPGDSWVHLRNRKVTVVKCHERGRHSGVRPRRDPRARSHREAQPRLKLRLHPMLEDIGRVLSRGVIGSDL